MHRLDNPRHERFAQQVARGDSHSKAYAGAFGRPANNVTDVNGHRLLRNAKVSQRVSALRETAESRMEVETLLTYEAKRRFLAETMRDPAQSIMARLKALQLDNLLAGHDGPPPPPPRTTSEEGLREKIVRSPALRERLGVMLAEATEAAAAASKNALAATQKSQDKAGTAQCASGCSA